MCKIALIDDIKDQYELYKIRLAKKGIDLVFMDFIPDYPKIVDWILDKEIEFVLVDYKLDTLYDFQGSQLVQYLNNRIRDLQCVLFTSNTTDDDLVMDRLKVDKNVFNSNDEKYNNFIEDIKQAVKVFRNRREYTLKEYQELKEKKEKKGLSATELDEMKDYYKILVSYGMVEKLPDEFFKTDIESRIDILINEVGEYIKESKK